MFGGIHLWSHLVIDFFVGNFFFFCCCFVCLFLMVQFHSWESVCSYIIFLLDSVLREYTFLEICPFLLGCPFCCCLLLFSHQVMSNSFATQWTAAHQSTQARILEWVAISFARGYSQARDWTRISCIGRCILSTWEVWATREALSILLVYNFL